MDVDMAMEETKKQRERKKNQKNFNSFIHSINIILDMVFLYTLYIFKGTYAQSIDCGVKKVCEGLWHRMACTALTVHVVFFSLLHRLYVCPELDSNK